MICPSCQHENRPAARFCEGCGVGLPRCCPACGAELRPTARFCDACGAAVDAGPTPASPPAVAPAPAPSLEEQFEAFRQALPRGFREKLLTDVEGELRLVTVLFADMSRSVQTTAALHPEEAAAVVSRLLQAMVDVLLKYEGRVDRFLGDGLLAVFGVPAAHESDAERAILAALEIREAAGELGLEVTAGINTGEVYAGGVGSEQHREMTVMGPVVNLASRLQGCAEPGQILVGEATHRHTRRAFAFSPLSLAVKGIAQPITAYAVERALPRPEKARGIEGLRAELIGRDEELARLKDALAELRQGRGQMVSVIGEAGVGKSRLVAELKEGVQAFRRSGVQAFGSDKDEPVLDAGDPERPNARTPERLTPLWLEGRCLELGVSASYWAFVDMFRQHFGLAAEEDEQRRGERLVAALRGLVAGGALTEERSAEIGPLLGHLLSIRFGSEWDQRLAHVSPEEIKQQLFLAIRDFLTALAKRQPVILLFEDLHWADPHSLEVISLLMETLTRDPLLLLCVYRPEREHRCWHLGSLAARKCAGRYTEISLRELTPPQSRRLVESLLTIDNLPASVKELILAKARGNPFFVEEVVRSLIASGMVYREGETWRAKAGIESVSVPESVQSVILSRVDRLERKLRAVLESASVIGRLFRRRLLEYTTRETAALERALWELEDQALIYQERVVPEEEYSFQHVLTQETIYGSILRRRRAGFHQKLAEAIEALYEDGLEEYYEQLAYHYERSGAAEKAVEYRLKAAEKAGHLEAHEAAIQHLTAALALLDELPEDEPHLRQRYQAVMSLWGANRNCRAYERGLEVAHEYLARAERAGYPWCIAAAHWVVHWALCWSHVASGVWGSESSNRLLEESVEKILPIADEHGLRDWQARARIRLAPTEDDPPRAEAMLREVLQAPEGVPRRDIQEAYGWLAFVCALQGKWDAAATALRESIPFGEPDAPTGVRQGMLAFLGPMEAGMIQAGKQAEFIAFCEEARALYAQAGVSLALNQWHLEPAAPSEEFRQLLFRDDFDGPELRPDWQWVDPAQANSHSLSERPGHLTLRPERRVDNPRIFVEAQGDFALEAKLAADWDERPSAWNQTGLFVWHNTLNSVHLHKYDRGSILRGDIRLGARVAGAHDGFGRGQLWGESYYLRLERTGERFAALCSTDGVHWLTCGHVVLPVKGPLRVGVSTCGSLVVHFDYVQLLGRGDVNLAAGG